MKNGKMTKQMVALGALVWSVPSPWIYTAHKQSHWANASSPNIKGMLPYPKTYAENSRGSLGIQEFC